MIAAVVYRGQTRQVRVPGHLLALGADVGRGMLTRFKLGTVNEEMIIGRAVKIEHAAVLREVYPAMQ